MVRQEIVLDKQKKELEVIEISSDSDDNSGSPLPIAARVHQELLNEVIEISSDEDASSILWRKSASKPMLSYESDSDTAPNCKTNGRYNTSGNAFTAHRAAKLSLDKTQSGTQCIPTVSINMTAPARTARSKSASPVKQTRPKPLSKKAVAEAKAAHLAQYALQWFNIVNASVFGGRLPQAKLVWSKYLTASAGRARYKRDRHGEVTCSIELAVKILNCEERIRNTLSHEMCHLASWTISGSITEQHGTIFHSWATAVVDAHPEVKITTKHNYEIDYPYNWRCEQCGYSYGRFSRSIKPTDMCGVPDCGGRLSPQFEVRKRAAKTSQVSLNAAGKTRDSPRRPVKSDKDVYDIEVFSVHSDPEPLDSAESDSEIDILATTFASASIKI